MKIRTIFFFLLLKIPCSWSQAEASDVWIVPTSEEYLTACLSNTIEVYARQKKPIALNDIKARLITSYRIENDSTFIPVGKELTLSEIGENKFLIEGIDTVGVVEFEIHLEDGVQKRMKEVVPLSVRFLLGNKNLQKVDFLEAELVREAKGIVAEVDFKGLYAYGQIQQFKLIGIRNNQRLPEMVNKHSVFSQEAKAMLNSLKKGDMIIFKDIRYKVGTIEQVFDYNFIIELE
jgi:hypothetical protein